MRRSLRMGLAGFGVAALGWGTALGALAPAANAASAQARSANYDSTATATAGNVIVPDVQDSLISVTAGASPGASSGPQRAGLGTSRVVSALKDTSGLGPVLAAGLQAANPGTTDLVSVAASATHTGTSTACASILSADCTAGGQDKPVVLKLSLSGLTSALNAADYALVLTLNGPRATCSAGPAGSGQLSAAASRLAGSTLDIQDKGRSVLPKGPVPLVSGEAFSALLGADKNSPLQTLMSALATVTPLKVTINPGSHKTSGSTATASTGEVKLVSGIDTVLDIQSATVKCGANTLSADSYTAPGLHTNVVKTGDWDAPRGLNSDVPAVQILTEEGSSAPGITVPALYNL